MNYPSSRIGGDSSSAHVHPRPIDSPHMQYLPHNHLSSAEQFSSDSVHQGYRATGTAHQPPARGSDRLHTSTQVCHPQGMPLQHGYNRTTRQPRDHAVFETYDRYRDTGSLYQTNPGPTVPRHSPSHVWGLNGQPRVWSRNIDRPTRSQNLQTTNTDSQFLAPETEFALPEFAFSEQLDQTDIYQERVKNFAEMHARDLRSHASGGVKNTESQSSRMQDIIRQFDFVRRSSGKRAKFRRSVKQWLKIEQDHIL